MPTAQQLKAYVGSLPQLYRDILTAFAQAAYPMRRYLEGMAVDVLHAQMTNLGMSHTDSEVYAALEQLERKGFFQVDVIDQAYVGTTPLGEELLAAVTGRLAPKATVPELPNPTW